MTGASDRQRGKEKKVVVSEHAKMAEAVLAELLAVTQCTIWISCTPILVLELFFSF